MIHFYALSLFALLLLAAPVGAQTAAAAQAAVEASTLDPGVSASGFGVSIAVDGDRAVVGSTANAAYVFLRVEGAWTLEATLEGTQANSGFGRTVAISGDRVVVGAPFYVYETFPGESDRGGAAFVFVRSTSGTVDLGWTQEEFLRSPFAGSIDGNGNAVNATFGSAVAIDGDRAFVGAETAPPNGIASGAVYVYSRQVMVRQGGVARAGGTWSLDDTIVGPNPVADDRFGSAISASGSRVLIGARSRDVQGAESGEAYVYASGSTGWGREATLITSGTAAGDRFGWSVALGDDGAAVVGVPNSGGTEAGQGSVAVFSPVTSGGYQLDVVLTADAPVAAGVLGLSVAIDGARIVAGAERSATADEPSALVFNNADGAWSQIASLSKADAGAATRTPAAGGGARIGGVAAVGGTAFLGVTTSQTTYVFSDIRPVSTGAAPDAGFALGVPRPNPTAGHAALALSVGTPQHVRADLVDALGRTVRTLFDGAASGTLDVGVETAGLAPGVYAVRARGDAASAVRRLTVVR